MCISRDSGDDYTGADYDDALDVLPPRKVDRMEVVHLPEAPADGPYARSCTRCGARPTEPCWNLRTRQPNAWPHRERLAEGRDDASS